MGTAKDLTGMRFGSLTVLCKTDQRKNKRVIWKCMCDCGNIAMVDTDSLVRGSTKSCGCMKKNDLTGMRFGKLTVLGATEERKGGRMIWKCKCDCGKIAFVSGGNLKNGFTRSCGCLKAEVIEGQKRDITGQRFGRLVVIRQTEERNGCGQFYWECRCDCGNITLVTKGNLISGSTKSCGCLNRENITKHKDLVGMRFGKLTVLRITEERYNGNIVWECRCDCGNIKRVSGGALKAGDTKSCGCLRRRNFVSPGIRVGHLEVIRKTDEKDLNGINIWECRCDCGNTVFVKGNYLRRGGLGANTSCGCMNPGGGVQPCVRLMAAFADKTNSEI